jgi:hypothetical protein
MTPPHKADTALPRTRTKFRLLFFGGLLAAFLSAAFAGTPHLPAQGGTPTPAPSPLPTEALAEQTRIGSTDGIFVLAVIILLIVLIPLFWQMWTCRSRD